MPSERGGASYSSTGVGYWMCGTFAVGYASTSVGSDYEGECED